MPFAAIHRLTHASVLDLRDGPSVEGDAYQREQG